MRGEDFFPRNPRSRCLRRGFRTAVEAFGAHNATRVGPANPSRPLRQKRPRAQEPRRAAGLRLPWAQTPPEHPPRSRSRTLVPLVLSRPTSHYRFFSSCHTSTDLPQTFARSTSPVGRDLPAWQPSRSCPAAAYTHLALRLGPQATIPLPIGLWQRPRFLLRQVVIRPTALLWPT